MVVHLPDGNKFKFIECDDGLYYYDMGNMGKTKNKVNAYSSSSNKSFSFLSTVSHNKSKFNRKQVIAADKARYFQQCIYTATKSHCTNSSPKDINGEAEKSATLY